MFCPKCGTKNPDDGKYCRSCGVDLGNVSAALAGKKPSMLGGLDQDLGLGLASDDFAEKRRRNNPDEVYGDGVKAIISGVGFLIVSIALFTTGVAGGHAWWWAMLFPAFSFLAKGISDLVKAKRMASSRALSSTVHQNTIGGPQASESLPPAMTNFVAPESRYKTGDLVPPSVTDSTTKLLELDTEGQTMTLPKK